MSTHGSDKNIALAPDLLAEVEKLASSEHRSTDEIINDAARTYLDVQRTIAEMDSFVARNRKEAIKKGWTERSISTVVKKHRQEKRGL
jgi:metal-responsive CopG/Arc/MetJ family transcriptional regulator